MIEALLQQKARLLCRADFLEYVPLSNSKKCMSILDICKTFAKHCLEDDSEI